MGARGGFRREGGGVAGAGMKGERRVWGEKKRERGGEGVAKKYAV